MKKNLFKNIRLLALDVDGVLTKGEIIYDSAGRELKIFNVKDGLGIFLLSRMGIKIILVTARDSRVMRKRAQDMHIDKVYAGILPKESLISKMKKDFNVRTSQICFVGDDLIDIGLMKRVGVSVAVADAPHDVKKVATYITKHKGGEGAVREIVERILKAKNLWKKTLEFLSHIGKKR